MNSDRRVMVKHFRIGESDRDFNLFPFRPWNGFPGPFTRISHADAHRGRFFAELNCRNSIPGACEQWQTAF